MDITLEGDEEFEIDLDDFENEIESNAAKRCRLGTSSPVEARDEQEANGTYVLPSTSCASVNSLNVAFDQAFKELSVDFTKPIVFDSWTDMLKPKIALDAPFHRLNTVNYIDELVKAESLMSILLSKDSRPKSNLFDLISFNLVNSVKNALSEDDLPPVYVLSFLLYEILIPHSNDVIPADQSTYLLLDTLLSRFPPAHAEMRYYWLALFHRGKESKNTRKMSPKSKKTEMDMAPMVEGFRLVFSSAFLLGEVDESLMNFLVKMLELDLFYFINPFETSVPMEDSSSTNVKILANVPLAYILFHDALTRKRGIGREGVDKLISVVQLAAQNRLNPRLVDTCFSLVAVVFETFRVRSSIAKSNAEEIPVELMEDVRDFVRKALNLSKGTPKNTPQRATPNFKEDAKFDKNDLKSLLPLSWIHSLIDNCNALFML